MRDTLIKGLNFPFEHFTTKKLDGDMREKIFREKFLKSQKIDPRNLVLAKQIHSGNVKIVSKSDRGSFIDNCDALISDDKDIMLGIFTADCMPLLIAVENPFIKAAVHGGWRGLADNIIEHTIDIIVGKFNIEPDKIRVYIGPHIQSCCYETGADIADIFKFPLVNNKLNLLQIAKNKLHKLGVKSIDSSPYCTMCDEGHFFSYRRDKTLKRMLTVI
ncbi:MAG: peptidoglycan editing factor PgeF [Elusimicrobiota bacterium]|jgi:YfiH family protein|nr:peptidoglycan editing factor PgeF [Elusimicrobiota bacterium]